MAQHYQTPKENSLRPGQEKQVTFLIQNISKNHSAAMKNLLESQGYKIKILPPENEIAQKHGMEHVNRGQCYPVIYCVGSLVAFIKSCLSQGWTKTQLIDTYVFCTVSSAGSSCRFQMYEEEYRNALRNLGMGDFRVQIMPLSAKKVQTQNEYKYPKSFKSSFIQGLVLGDVLNEKMLSVRPFECVKGETDQIFDKIRPHVGKNCRTIRQIAGSLQSARQHIDKIKCDFSLIKPRVLVTGEIYCALSDGHLSSDFFKWLESEGACVIPTNFADYLRYQIWRSQNMVKLTFFAKKNKTIQVYKQFISKTIKSMYSNYHLNTMYKQFSSAIQSRKIKLDSILELIKLSKPYYDKNIYGGEGFIEISKHIKAVKNNYADMVVSLKPFTCMPSVCSDAIQTKVEQDYPGSIFVALELDGNSVVNMQSRVLMKLHEAKHKLQKTR